MGLAPFCPHYHSQSGGAVHLFAASPLWHSSKLLAMLGWQLANSVHWRTPIAMEPCSDAHTTAEFSLCLHLAPHHRPFCYFVIHITLMCFRRLIALRFSTDDVSVPAAPRWSVIVLAVSEHFFGEACDMRCMTSVCLELFSQWFSTHWLAK